jgi:glycosyltransferase involved in cell wall biosynthesis
MVSFAGHVEDVQGLLAAHDVLACCSVRPEAFGQGVIQAMASGLAVLATDHGGPREIIEHGRTGILVPPNDPIALAEALEHLIVHRTVVGDLGRAAIETAGAYADGAMKALLEDSLHDMAGLRRREVESATPAVNQ